MHTLKKNILDAKLQLPKLVKNFLAIFTVLALISLPVTANAAGKTIIDKNHTDAFFVEIRGEKPKVMIRNGIRATLYDMATTEIHIADYAYLKSPDCASQFLDMFKSGSYPQLGEEGKDGYHGVCGAPGSEPGMSAPGQKEDNVNVKIKFTKVTGPGKIGFFNNNDLATDEDGKDALVPFLESGSFYINAGDVLPIPGHRHGHWYFEHAGVYTLTGRAIVTKNDDGSKKYSDPFTLTFRVLKSKSDQRNTPAERVLSQITDDMGQKEENKKPNDGKPSKPGNADAGAGDNQNPGATDQNPGNPDQSQPSQPEPQLPQPPSPQPQPQPQLPKPDANPDNNGTAESPSYPSTPSTSPRTLIDKGHIDLFNVQSENGKLVLNAKDDTGITPVLRKPEEILMHVNDNARIKFPPEFAKLLGSKANADFSAPLYFLGQNGENQDSTPFPGWDTSGVRPDYTAINLQFLEVSGPGKVYLYNTPGVGGPRAQLASQNFELKSGEEIQQNYPAHVHTNWIFTKPGVYTMKVRAVDARSANVGNLPEVAGMLYMPGAGVSNTATYTWYVGSEVPNHLLGGMGNQNNSSQNGGMAQNDGNAGNPPAGNANNGAANSNSGLANSQANSSAPANHGNSASATNSAVHKQSYVDAIFPRIKDDRTQPAKWVDPASLAFAIGNAGKARISESVGHISAGSDVWMISSSQVSGVPWLGVNSQHPSLLAKTTGHLKLALTSFSGPGAMEVFYSNNFGGVGKRIFSGVNGSANGSIVLSPNVHAHPNWVFSKPGTYKVGITTTATLRNGQNVSNHTVLTFNVGAGSGVTSGHFDLGAMIGKALAGSAGTTNSGGSTANNVNLGRGAGHAANNGVLDDGEGALGGENNANAKPLTSVNADESGNSLDNGNYFGGANSWWNANVLLSVVIVLLLINVALSAMRLMQSRKKA